MTPNVIDPARQKRVVEQTVQRLRTDANFRGAVQQAMQAAHDRNPDLGATNVALILVQIEQLTREAVLEKLESARLPSPTVEQIDVDLARFAATGEPIEATEVDGIRQGWRDAIAVVVKMLNDFGAVKILRATGPPPPSSNGPGGLES